MRLFSVNLGIKLVRVGLDASARPCDCPHSTLLVWVHGMTWCGIQRRPCTDSRGRPSADSLAPPELVLQGFLNLPSLEAYYGVSAKKANLIAWGDR
jgi:hypothetical protein